MPGVLKPLFRPEVLRSRMVTFNLPPRVALARERLTRWSRFFTSGESERFKEKHILPDFLTDIFCGVLGYAGPVESPERHTLLREQVVEVDGKFADGVLGEFCPDARQFIVAVEGKGPKDPLDRPYGGRRLSAVEQGYQYATNLPCDWIVVTSMRETRLYNKGSNQYTCEIFDTVRLASDEGHLRKFVFLLGAERVAPQLGRCHLYELLAASDRADRDLTREYYANYSRLRHDVFSALCRANPDEDKSSVLTATQMILDRVLFCSFCEDRGLLPAESVKKAYLYRDPYNPRPVWDNYRGLFRAINDGNDLLDIPKYNGGLFAANAALDRLAVPDEVCRQIKALGDYDYRAREAVDLTNPADAATHVVDVDILGHIFEQSITDLERMRDEIEGRAAPAEAKKTNGRRKQEGAFYTPHFITRHIVGETLGQVIAGRLEALRARHAADARGQARAALEHPEIYDLETLKPAQKNALIAFWSAWQEDLSRLRVLDPACGSGAFLIEAFDQLYAAYQSANQRLEELRGYAEIFDLNRQILQQNLYGVDLNEEAVEICRLSLWIKTAERGKILADLEHTIRVGNSVVDDPAVHPKAFAWRERFPEVFAEGGFDVVIGNPPYIRQEWIAPYKDYWSRRFRSYHGVADIFIYFYELGAELLREGGRLGFITSGSWVRGNFGGPLRKFLSSAMRMESMIDFGEFQPFEDAEMIRPTIAVASKNPPGGEMKLFKWLTKGKPPEDLAEVMLGASDFPTSDLGEGVWRLEGDSITSLYDKLSKRGVSLNRYTRNTIFYGIKTGYNEAFIIDAAQRERLLREDPGGQEIIKPFIQGTNMRSWFIEDSNQFIIFARHGINIEKYPAILEYLATQRERLEPKPSEWIEQGKRWQGRKSGAYQWYELQDTVDYWEAFEREKIVWPDISKLPRFSMDTKQRYLGNTGYIIPGGDYYLLGILASWVTWFFISKTAQPLRLRGERWQYRLIAQFMAHVPIPDADPPTREAIAALARRCNELGGAQYQKQEQTRRRLLTAFASGGAQARLNNKADEWWSLSFMELGEALAASFKLKANPFRNPRAADEWEPYFKEKQTELVGVMRELAASEAELNDRVYRLFQLTPDEIRILQKEVEH